jgi:DNA-binding IclR family transcriptional regulator
MDVFRLIEALAASTRPLGPGEIQRQTGIAPATLNRLLKRGQAEGYVRRVGHGAYEGGPALMRLGALAVQNARAQPFRGLLSGLALSTGLNAELYALTTEGPVFLLGASGKGERRIPYREGQVVDNLFEHPAALFFFQRYPEAFGWRRTQMEHAGVDQEALHRRVEEAVSNGFVVERGRWHPELARAAMPNGDYAYCVCLAGFLSDFPPQRDEQLHALMRERMLDFEAAQKYVRESEAAELAGERARRHPSLSSL